MGIIELNIIINLIKIIISNPLSNIIINDKEDDDDEFEEQDEEGVIKSSYMNDIDLDYNL